MKKYFRMVCLNKNTNEVKISLWIDCEKRNIFDLNKVYNLATKQGFICNIEYLKTLTPIKPSNNHYINYYIKEGA